PRERVAAERVLEAVAGDPARLVERERVKPLAAGGDLPRAAGPHRDRELAGERAGLRRPGHRERLPERHAPARAEDLAALLVIEVERASLRVDEHLPRLADLLAG